MNCKTCGYPLWTREERIEANETPGRDFEARLESEVQPFHCRDCGERVEKRAFRAALLSLLHRITCALERTRHA